MLRRLRRLGYIHREIRRMGATNTTPQAPVWLGSPLGVVVGVAAAVFAAVDLWRGEIWAGLGFAFFAAVALYVSIVGLSAWIGAQRHRRRHRP